MDDTQLGELMGDSALHWGEVNDEVVYLVKKSMKDTCSPFGNQLRIVLSGNNVLTEGSNEYIINYTDFIEKMLEHNYHIVESELFKSFPCNLIQTLSKTECDISFLNRYCVFRKGESPKLTESLESLKSLESTESLESLESLESTESTESTESETHVRFDVEITHISKT